DQIRTQLSTALIGVLSQTLMARKPEGLVAAYEMMVVTSAIQNMMRENKVFNINSAIQTGRKYGMFLLDDYLFKLWRDGLVVKEDCLRRAANPGDLARKIAQAEKGIIEDDSAAKAKGDDDDDDAAAPRPAAKPQPQQRR